MRLGQEWIRFIDSYNFIPMSLKDFSSTYNLKQSKKFCPHGFNKPENWDYCGRMPDIKYFEPNKMQTEERLKFYVEYVQLTVGKVRKVVEKEYSGSGLNQED